MKQLLNENFFQDALKKNFAAIPIKAEVIIREAAGDWSVVACRGLDVEYFAEQKLCHLKPDRSPLPVLIKQWGGEDNDRLQNEFEQVVWKVRWDGHVIRVVSLSWMTGCGTESRDWVVAKSESIANSFILEVERKTHSPGKAILVFSDGHWHRSHSLYQAVQAATFDDLILADDLKSKIREEFAAFLASKNRYERLGIAWRRGALFIGPPGNGKTHCVRALVKELGIACLYVQSLSHNYYTPEQLWQMVFKRARGLRPCVLVLEDLDSLVSPENRSFFLNQLDGFEQNHGLIVLATTNHADRIDAAIIDRPSRFDRKYHFTLPTSAERQVYLAGWQNRLLQETQWEANDVAEIAVATEGFSFAYLKELIISSVLSWIQDESAPFRDVLNRQAKFLASQMETEPIAKPVARKRKRATG